MTDGDLQSLVEVARAAREHAYAPYSGFLVGAAALSASGRVYSGCNVENASYGGTICAERVAVTQMVAAGERELAAIAVFTESDPPAMPCGMCRQVLFEFGASAIVVVASPLRVDQTTLRELLPAPFLLKR